MQKRAFWMGVLGGGVAALVLGAGLGVKALAQNESKPAEPKPAEKPRLPVDPFGDLDQLFNNLPDGVDKDQLKKMFEMRKQMLQNPGFGGLGGFGGVMPFGGLGPMNAAKEQGRLGVMAGKPSETLIEQLDLPRGQGLVIEEIVADSAAAKAGLKAHDILLEMNGKPVADDVREFKKSLEDVKADQAVDMVVLRKGKRETVKGVKMPEVKVEKPAQNLPGAFQFQFPNGGFGGLNVGGPGKVVSVSRNGDNFSVTQTEGGMTLSVTGSVVDTQAVPSEIKISEAGKESQTYGELTKVPQEHREKVKGLLQMIEKK